MNEKVIKIPLAILLLLCLFNMPYGYYQLVRFIAMVAFALLAFKANEQNNSTMLIVYGTLALLFQPFIKISLGRELWNLVDLVVGIGLIVSIYKKK